MPNVIVTFYDNFHLEEVDVSGVLFPDGPASGSETRLGHFTEVNPPFGDYTKNYTMKFVPFKVKVVASGGSFKLRFKINEEEFTSGTIPYNASATAINALLPVPIQDEPIPELLDLGGSVLGLDDFISTEDLGPSEWLFKFVADSGIALPIKPSIQALSISLGAVIEIQPAWDEIEYTVPLTQRVPAQPEPPSGSIEGTGYAAGARRSRRLVSGGRSNVSPT